MKKLSLIIITSLLYLGSFAQIGIRVEPTNVVTKPIQYDSLQPDFEFYQPEEMYMYKKYIGQNIFFPVLTEKQMKNYSFEGLFVAKDKVYNTGSVPFESTDMGVLRAMAIDKAKTNKDRESMTNAFEKSKTEYLKSKRYKSNLYYPYIHNSKELDNKSAQYPLIYNDPNALEAKTFTVLDVLSGDYKASENLVANKKPTTLQLSFKLLDENNDTLYWQVYPRYIKEIFILQGYFDKQKKEYVDNNYVYREEIPSIYSYKGDRREENDCSKIAVSHKVTSKIRPNEVMDINTNQPVDIAELSKWMCVDISLMEGVNKYELFYILRNESNAEIKVSIGQMAKSGFVTEDSYNAEVRYIQLKEEERAELDLQKQIEREEYIAKRKSYLISKYGESIGMKIYFNQVELGMTKEMCRESWGEYNGIAKNATIEIWSYGMASLTFNGDKLIQIVSF